MVLVVFAGHRRRQHRDHDFRTSQSYEADSIRQSCTMIPCLERTKHISDIDPRSVRHSEEENLVDANRRQRLSCLNLTDFAYSFPLLVSNQITPRITAGGKHNSYSAVLVEHHLRQIAGDGSFIVRM